MAISRRTVVFGSLFRSTEQLILKAVPNTLDEIAEQAEDFLRSIQKEDGSIGDSVTTVYAAKAFSARGMSLGEASTEGGKSLLGYLLDLAREFLDTPMEDLVAKWNTGKPSPETTLGMRLMWALNPKVISDPKLLGDLVARNLDLMNLLLKVERTRINIFIYTLMGLKDQAPVYVDWVNSLRNSLFGFGNVRDGWPEYRGGNQPSLDHTAAALMALNVNGSQFFASRRNQDGGFNEDTYRAFGESNIDTTSWAVMSGSAKPSLSFYQNMWRGEGVLANKWQNNGQPFCHHCVYDRSVIWSTATALLALSS